MNCRIKSIVPSCGYRAEGIASIMLLDFDDFDGFRFEDDEPYSNCFVTDVLRHGELSDMEAPDMVAKYTSTYQNGIYTHKIETFVSDLSAGLLSTLHLASRRRSVVFFRTNNGRYFGFGYEAGAKLSYTSQTNDGIGSLVTITANSIYPLFEVSKDAFNEYAPAIYTITVRIDSANIDQCTITATGDVIGMVQSPNKETYTITTPRAGTVTVSVEVKDGYQIKQVNVDAVSQGDISSYTFVNIQKHHTMRVWLEEIPAINFLIRNDLLFFNAIGVRCNKS